MGIDQYESSRQLAEPVNLYLFRYGQDVNSYYAYTDAEEPKTYLGIEYTPAPVSRGEVHSSGGLDKTSMNVDLPKNCGLSDLYRVYPPTQVVTLKIFQGHVSDLSGAYFVVWAGRVLSRDVKDNIAGFNCEPIATSMRRSGLRRNYQYGCPHVLYGAQCGANRATASTTVTVVSVSGDSVTLPDGWNGAIDFNKYLGGILEWTSGGETELRTILRITGGKTLRLSGVPRNLSTGSPATAILGCSRQMGDCGTLHNNIQNFGGQPWIPSKNPFAKLSPFG